LPTYFREETAKELLDLAELLLMYTFTLPRMIDSKKQPDVEADGEVIQNV